MWKLKTKALKWRRSLYGKYLYPGYESVMPSQINIEAAGVCNLRCSCCPHGISKESMRHMGIMSADTFHRVLDHIDIPVKLAYLHLHGEPFLNPNLADFVQELSHRQISVNLYSNCTVVDEDKLDAILNVKHVAINFSADLLGAEYYESIRIGARYIDTLNQLDFINEIFVRHNMFFNVIIVVDRNCESRLDEIVACCESLYGRYSRLNGILLGSRFPWPRLPWTGDLNGHLKRGHKRCSYAFEGLSVLWNGDATMCSFDYTGECVVGSLMDSNYSEIFNNAAARRFRTLHWRHADDKLPLCQDCLLDRYNPVSVSLHRAAFLKKDYNDKKTFIGSFFQL